jgi:hypothetical protein
MRYKYCVLLQPMQLLFSFFKNWLDNQMFSTRFGLNDLAKMVPISPDQVSEESPARNDASDTCDTSGVCSLPLELSSAE